MTPQEEAKSLVKKFMDADYTDISIHGAKQCARICIEEIINALKIGNSSCFTIARYETIYAHILNI